MSEGPYRDLGSGFARLTGTEAPRRAASPITCVEDALYELLRNSRDSNARNIFVASRLSARRYRTLTIIDDGDGFPETFKSSIFDPGVTSRFLAPTRNNPEERPHGAGLSLHHIKAAAIEANAPRNADPTSIQATFDTNTLPEKTLQTHKTHKTHKTPSPLSSLSTSRTSSSNLTATTLDFATRNPDISIYYGTPATILATLVKNHIILQEDLGKVILSSRRRVVEWGIGVGLEISSRTAGRILSGDIQALGRLSRSWRGVSSSAGNPVKEDSSTSEVILRVGEIERGEITAILRKVAAASYVELNHVEFRSTAGKIQISARVQESEDEYG